MVRSPAALPLAIAAVLLLGACQKSPNEVAQDVATASESANQDSKAARKDADADRADAAATLASAQQTHAEQDAQSHRTLTAAESDALIVQAKTRFDVASTDAEGRHAVAIEACGTLSGAELAACRSAADAALALAQSEAVAERDAALVAADQRR